MSATLVDYFLLQLAQQASLYDLTYMKGRALSREQVENLFFRMLEILPVTTTLELGAHEATFSRTVKEKFPQREARAYEANPQVYAHFFLEGAVERNGVKYIHTAVGANNGSIPFYLYDQLEGKAESRDSRRQSLLLREKAQDAHFTTVQVPQARLDTLCANDDASTLYALWIDVEGASGLVLDGAQATLNKTLLLYIELESVPQFADQSLDRDILARLLENDFLPVARDFQFRHQYNALFVKKEYLPQVEHIWHRFLQESLRRSLRRSFKLEHQEQHHVPVAPQPLPRLQFASVYEIQEAMHRLPLLRAPRAGIDPQRTVVACHICDLEEAIAFYQQAGPSLPAFYVLNPNKTDLKGFPPRVAIHEFSELVPGMEVQLFFHQSQFPIQTAYPALAVAMQRQGISSYFLELHGIKQFYERQRKVPLSDADWDIILNFTNRLGDAESQYTYLALCRARHEAEPGYLPIAGYPQYGHPLVSVEAGDVICEGGGYTDLCVDSATLNFQKLLKGNGRIVCFEPVRETFQQLKQRFAESPEIVLENKALWSMTGHVSLSGSGASANVSQGSSDTTSCPCTSIDDYFSDTLLPSVIKLDIEGAEPEALKGAHRVLTCNLPRLIIAIHHARRGADWITVPRLLLEYNLPYDYFCGHHQPWFAETFVYAKKHA